jgi:hypothetical protein
MLIPRPRHSNGRYTLCFVMEWIEDVEGMKKRLLAREVSRVKMSDGGSWRPTIDEGWAEDRALEEVLL